MRLTLTNLGQLETIRAVTSIRQLVFVHTIRQIRRRTPNIQFTGDDISNQSGAVFLYQIDLPTGSGYLVIQLHYRCFEMPSNPYLFLKRRYCHSN